MTFINKSTGLPLADREYRAFISGGGEKLEVMISRKRVEVALKTVAPGPIDPPPPPPLVEPPATGTITPAQFGAALGAAKPGAVLQLGAGAYVMPHSPKFTAPVTIKGGTFASIDLQGAENITFEGCIFDYNFKAVDDLENSPFYFASCKRITFKDCKVIGSGDAAGYGNGRGLTFDNSADILVQGGSITKFHRAVYSDIPTRMTVKGVNISGIRSDGIQVHGGSFVRIENNWIHDFKTPPRSGDHADMIQFFAVGDTLPTTDFWIVGNKMDIGQGSQTQTMLISTQNGKAYARGVIDGNTIRNAHTHGIAIGPINSLSVQKNAVIAAPPNPADPENADYLKTWGAQHGIMVPIIDASGSGIVVRDNAFAGANWYGGPRIEAPGAAIIGNVTVSAGSLIPVGVGA